MFSPLLLPHKMGGQTKNFTQLRIPHAPSHSWSSRGEGQCHRLFSSTCLSFRHFRAPSERPWQQVQFMTQRAPQEAEQPIRRDRLVSLSRRHGAEQGRRPSCPRDPSAAGRPAMRGAAAPGGEGRAGQGRWQAPEPPQSGGNGKLKIRHVRGRGEAGQATRLPRRREGRPGAAEGAPLRAATAAGRAVPPLPARGKGLGSPSPPRRRGQCRPGPAAPGPAPRTGEKSPVSPRSPQRQPGPPLPHRGRARLPSPLLLPPLTRRPPPPAPQKGRASPGAPAPLPDTAFTPTTEPPGLLHSPSTPGPAAA